MGAQYAVLVIAATDSSGGAGLTRDVQTLSELATPVRCAVTAVTVQTDARLHAVHPLPPELVRAQIHAALAGGDIRAVKIGALGSAEIVQAVADTLPPRAAVPIVLDPVLVSSSGGRLLDRAAEQLLRRLLIPLVSVVTPNLPEAAALLGQTPALTEAERVAQMRALLALGPGAVLLKGGHEQPAAAAADGGAIASSAAVEVIDRLLQSGSTDVQYIRTARAPAQRRGTGCSASSAIAAQLAAGRSLAQACALAQTYVAQVLAHGR